MKKYLALLLTVFLAGCAPHHVQSDQHPLDKILPALRSRRAWLPSEVKLDLKHPQLRFTFMSANSIPLEVEVWGSDQNDYNVPMIRLNSQDALGEITKDELDQLKKLHQKDSNK